MKFETTDLLSGKPDIGIFHEPCVNHLFLKTPLITDFERRDFLLRHQTVNGEFVDFEVTGHLLSC